jgi:hypothetical protein
MDTLKPSTTQKSNENRAEKLSALGEYIGSFFIVLILASIKLFDVIHPVAEWKWIHKVAEIEPTVLAAALVTFIVFERWKVLGPTRKAVHNIEVACEKMKSVPDVSQVSDLLDASLTRVVDQLSSRTTLKINETAEDTYKNILAVFKSVEHDKPHTLKTLRHGIFHAEGARNSTPEDDQPYFAAFRDKMKEMSASNGANRWNVNVLYNVTHSDRLRVILSERLDLGSVGYKIRAMCLHDFSPVFSPMIVDDQHVFLAVFEEGKNRVSKSVYMHGERATKFFADYFDALWADRRVKMLREEGVNNQQGIEELKVAVAGIAALASLFAESRSMRSG